MNRVEPDILHDDVKIGQMYAAMQRDLQELHNFNVTYTDKIFEEMSTSKNKQNETITMQVIKKAREVFGKLVYLNHSVLHARCGKEACDTETIFDISIMESMKIVFHNTIMITESILKCLQERLSGEKRGQRGSQGGDSEAHRTAQEIIAGNGFGASEIYEPDQFKVIEISRNRNGASAFGGNASAPFAERVGNPQQGAQQSNLVFPIYDRSRNSYSDQNSYEALTSPRDRSESENFLSIVAGKVNAKPTVVQNKMDLEKAREYPNCFLFWASNNHNLAAFRNRMKQAEATIKLTYPGLMFKDYDLFRDTDAVKYAESIGIEDLPTILVTNPNTGWEKHAFKEGESVKGIEKGIIHLLKKVGVLHG